MSYKKPYNQQNVPKKAPISRQGQSRERAGSANREKMQESQAYWVKEKDEQLLHLVK